MVAGEVAHREMGTPHASLSLSLRRFGLLRRARNKVFAAKTVKQVGEGSVRASVARKTGFPALTHVGQDFDIATEVTVGVPP